MTDKGYHSNGALLDLAEMEIRSCVSEPDHGRRRWRDQPAANDAVYACRRRIKGHRGKRLLQKRGELVERSFAHLYETGGTCRTHLKRRNNILNRLLIHAGGFNLSLVMRKLHGVGKPRRLQGLFVLTLGLIGALWNALASFARRSDASDPRIGLSTPLRPAA